MMTAALWTAIVVLAIVAACLVCVVASLNRECEEIGRGTIDLSRRVRVLEIEAVEQRETR